VSPTIPAFASASEAMAMVTAGLVYLAAVDPAEMPALVQADCLRAQEQNEAIGTAVRARFLAAFTAGHGYHGDADYSPTSWLIYQTRVSKGAARIRPAPPVSAARPDRTRATGRPGRCSSTPSSAGRSTWSPGPAAWPPSCARTCSAPGWAGPACRWTWAAARTSRPRSAAR
jgi:hypothetical protein